MEPLSATIIALLSVGGKNLTGHIVKDLYASAKSLLAELIPNFDSDGVAKNPTEEKHAELDKRLQGLTDNQITELADRFYKLAEASGKKREADMLREKFIVREIQAKSDVNISLGGKGEQRFEGISSSDGRITIVTRQGED